MIGFLEALVETASVSKASESVGMSRQSAYRLRARLIGQPFDFAWGAALEFALQQVQHEALDRVLNGVAIPIFYKGEQVGERRSYPENLTRFLLDNPNRTPARDRERAQAVRAAALTAWNDTMKRVATGPIVWTPAEHKKAQAQANIMAAAAEAEGEPKTPKPPRPRLTGLARHWEEERRKRALSEWPR